jgi:hypothetical protein
VKIISELLKFGEVEDVNITTAPARRAFPNKLISGSAADSRSSHFFDFSTNYLGHETMVVLG